MEASELLKLAEDARRSAYAPYSSFSVGAALLTQSGEVFLGCNIESASFSPTCCAERVAFFKAISEGKSDFCAIAVCGGKIGEDERRECTPCGVCRQVMSEFCSDSFRIICYGNDGKIVESTLDALLPRRFALKVND